MNQITIREAGINDLEVVQALSERTFIETFAATNEPQDLRQYVEDNLNPNQLGRELLVPESTFWLAELEGEAVAYMKLNVGQAQTEPDQADSLEIQRIYVLSSRKGMGIGRALIAHAVQIAREMGLQRLWLGVWEENVSAIRFYEKIGFQPFGQHVFVLGEDRQTDHLMELLLGGPTAI